ncbi:MAG TPA: hypothetical protein VFW70_10285 [Methylomirabilota bacterium]|nr:hypothetical protein [Methylomirabilota bacterium]
MRRMTVAIAGLLVLLTMAAGHAQPAKPPASAGEDTGFIDYLRRQDPAAAERFIQLRDARDAAIENLRRASARYSAGGAALRAVSLPELREARRRYAEASLAMMDFLDARDRQSIARLETDVERLKRSLEERGRERPELERMLRGE